MTRFDQITLPRPADSVDVSPATTAKRTGPAMWIAPGSLEVPFDRELTTTEVAAVRALLTVPTDEAATWRSDLEKYLALTTPTTAQNTAAIRTLAHLALDMLDRK
ncbi:hypothetical protein [Nocardioides aurantiacus]|uniref:Uncharacterized protein n=1 Tax=Nocardioides aurantiacus TaxID=86796 RepID=A0A3N2CWA7_9ACTN|nr:hypothetical protein [Nocardioides aurantiacus]ROR91779.1 hypothetical protein EDD33_2654 [Nocardioides aurantiacus]